MPEKDGKGNTNHKQQITILASRVKPEKDCKREVPEEDAGRNVRGRLKKGTSQHEDDRKERSMRKTAKRSAEEKSKHGTPAVIAAIKKNDHDTKYPPFNIIASFCSLFFCRKLGKHHDRTYIKAINRE